MKERTKGITQFGRSQWHICNLRKKSVYGSLGHKNKISQYFQYVHVFVALPEHKPFYHTIYQSSQHQNLTTSEK